MTSDITVLVVEDDSLIRMSIATDLEDVGFKVYEAENSTEAIPMMIRCPEINILFTDVDMPGGVDGLKLAAAVRERWPLIQIIVTSAMRGVDVTSLPILAIFLPSLTALRPSFMRWEKWLPANCQIECCCSILNASGKNLTVTVEYDVDTLGGTILSRISDDSVSSLFVRRHMSLSRIIACRIKSAEVGLPRLTRF